MRKNNDLKRHYTLRTVFIIHSGQFLKFTYTFFQDKIVNEGFFFPSQTVFYAISHLALLFTDVSRNKNSG